MKKLLYLLFIGIAFSACGSDNPDPNPNPPTPPITEWDGDWNDSKDPHYAEYKGKYNPIEGEWIVVKKNGATFSDFLVYKFDTSRKLSTATVKPAEGKAPTFGTADSYIINGTAYKVKSTIYKYKLASDLKTLEITDGTVTLVLQPYDSGVWRWKGDWNDPNDPHYAIYKGKYNPIVGTWKLTHIDGHSVEPVLYSFNDKFEWNEVYAPPVNNQFIGKYSINDTGFRNITAGVSYKWSIKTNILTIEGQSNAAKGVHLTLSKYM